MLRQQAIRLAVLALLLPLLGGCPRGVRVESEPGPAYALEVINPLPYPMIVTYDDGTGVRLLGTVSASGRGRFMITQPARLQVTVIATDEARSRTVTRQVVLQPGAITEVTLGT